METVMSSTIEDLVDRASSGDGPAWSQLVRDYDALFRGVGHGFRLSREDVADAAQTTWALLFQNIDKVREPAKLRGWLSATMRRECIRQAARRNGDQLQSELFDVDLSESKSPEEYVLLAEQCDELWRAVDDLPVRQRALILELYAEESPSYQEIAASLSMPIGSIGPARARALKGLQWRLGGQPVTVSITVSNEEACAQEWM
jgi:RNA polymerase sigma factor (sigma-70 family)